MFCILLFTKSCFIWRLTDHLQLTEKHIQNKLQENLITLPVFQNEKKALFGGHQGGSDLLTLHNSNALYEGMKKDDRQS